MIAQENRGFEHVLENFALQTCSFALSPLLNDLILRFRTDFALSAKFHS